MKVSIGNCIGAIALACILPATLSTTATAQSITTTFTSNNGGGTGWGNFFDITVLGKSLHITKLDVNISGSVNTNVTIDVYITSKTYVGNDTNGAKWMKVATGVGKSLGTDKKTPVDISDFVLAPGSYGMAVYYTGAGMRYTNGTATNNKYKNKDVALSLGISRSSLWGGSKFSPRIWNGTIYYDTTNAAFYGTYGKGCKGSGGFPTMTPTKASQLKLGTPFIVDITNLPKSGVVVMMTGFRNNSFAGLPVLALDLKSLGAPGCRLMMEPFDFKALTNTAGKAKYITGIPNNKSFLGIALFHQVLVFDKTANQAGLTLSNAGGGVLGN